MSKKKAIGGILEEADKYKKSQPNELPDNWAWIKFDNAIKVARNRASAIKQKEYVDIGETPVVDQGKRLISGFTNNTEHIFTGELPVIVFGDHTRCLKWIDFDFAQGADGTKLLSPLDGLYAKYFYYLMHSIVIPDKGYSRHFKYLRESVLPIAPINEQKRIAEKVERLLSKIDEAEQLIDEAKETFEPRRSAILDKAFRGELLGSTYNIKFTTVTLQEICESITDGDHQAPPQSDFGIPFLVIGNINKGVLDFSNTRFVPREYYENINTKRKPQKGDVLYSVVGSYGIPVLVEEDKEFCFQRHIAIIRPNEKVCSKFLYYMLQTKNVYNQATEYATGTAQLTVPLRGLRKIQIQIPSIEIQIDIVETIERFTFIEEQTFNLIPTEYDLNKLRKSILSKAFKGELGTNDASDESAIELLKTILKEKKM